MAIINLTKGHDINISGVPTQNIISPSCPRSIKIIPDNFKGIKPKLLVKEGDSVKIGTKLFFNKINPDIFFCSNVGGNVKSIKLGGRRKIEEIELTCENNDTDFNDPSKRTIDEYTADEIKKILLESGLWPNLRQRPFSKIANPKDTPKSIFISAMPTAPFSLDLNFVLKDSDLFFEDGFKILKKLTAGSVNLVIDKNKKYDIFPNSDDVE